MATISTAGVVNTTTGGSGTPPRKNEKFFNQDTDIKTFKLLQSDPLISITQNAVSASLFAGSSNTYAVTIQATGTAGTVSAYDASGSPGNISITGLFEQVSSFFFGRNDILIPNAGNPSQTVNTAKLIFVSRPSLDEGIMPGSVTAIISNSGAATGSGIRLTVIDQSTSASDNVLKLGRIGDLVNISNTAYKVGTIFYDYGVMVFHGAADSATSNMFVTSTGANTGIYWGSLTGQSITAIASSGNTSRLNIDTLYYQTNKYIVRNIYFCRTLNGDFNFTSNPTSKNADGTLLTTIQNVPSAYITTIGLYNNDDECLAVAKISPPIRKNAEQEFIFRVLLDF